MTLSLNLNALTFVGKYKGLFHVCMQSNGYLYVHQQKFLSIAHAINELCEIQKIGLINDSHWLEPSEEVNSLFLICLESTKKKRRTPHNPKVHIWNGQDTYCRMWSVEKGGIVNKTDFTLTNSATRKSICSMCLNKAPSEYLNYATTKGSEQISDEFECDKELFIYKLKLQNGRYYVGHSMDPLARIQKHLLGKGAAWTKTFPLLNTISVESAQTTNWKIAETIENHRTLALMQEYGWKNVRGGFWCDLDEEITKKNLEKHRLYIEVLGFNVSTILHK
ncbi:GIY-YIG nuclease family protein [Vibrio harveyi]|uniref:GIY-YIG nuclease family protein n=3 Tax=Vibrio harveyi TaxID=669 RepID=UPI0038CD1FDE